MKDQDKYKLEYPSNLEPRTRLWITKEEDLFSKGGTVYKVVQVVRPRIKGAKPQLVLQPQENVDASEWKIPF